MSAPETNRPDGPNPHEQMLRLVAKGFYKELVNYGVKEPEIVTVASHLLDNVVLKSPPESNQIEKYNELFRIEDIEDKWDPDQRLSIRGHDARLEPLKLEKVPVVLEWLKNPAVRNSFFPRLPSDEEGLYQYFLSPNCEYFSILHGDRFVGIIGSENIDFRSKKLKMAKLVGDSEMRGKGIGKRATFLFLYHVFRIRKFHKVYLHSLDINIRNLNLNGNLGFWLEGVFFEESEIDGERVDLVRMALTEPVWTSMFSETQAESDNTPSND